MAKANRKGRNKDKFVMLTNGMIDSPAWQSLSANAQALWLHIRRRYLPDNNGDIPLSCREAAEKLNVGKTTAAAAFDELIDKGFIKVGEHSAFHLKIKRARRWIMTHEVLDGKAPTNEWREWGKDKN